MSAVMGGPASQVTELVVRLQKEGTQNVILSCSRAEDRGYIEQVERCGATVVELASTGVRYPISARVFRELPELSRHADVVHLWGYWGAHNLVYRFSPACRRKAFVISALNMIPIALRSHRKKAIFHKWVGRPLLRRAARVIAITESEAEDYRRNGVPPGRIATIPLAVSDEFFRAVALRGRPSECVRILFVGRLHEVKGLQRALPALARIRREAPEFKLLVVGPDVGYGAVLERMTRDLGLDEVVEFCGPLYGEDKIVCFRNADVYLVPSVFEQISHSILEGAAAGLPVVYTKGCSFPALARASGGIETDGTEEQLGEALRRLLCDPALRERMGKAARACIAGGYLWSQVASAYAAVYRDATETGTDAQHA
jgi:glycosyltransferase involved in cell wall biosynthesis